MDLIQDQRFGKAGDGLLGFPQVQLELTKHIEQIDQRTGVIQGAVDSQTFAGKRFSTCIIATFNRNDGQ